jgi:DNA-binding transcriptional ArsR family regulator
MVAHGDDSIARVSAGSIACAVGMSKDTAARALRVLMSAGLVAQPKPQRVDGRFTNGGYRLGVPPEVLSLDRHRLSQVMRSSAKPSIGTAQPSLLDRRCRAER